MDDWPTEGDLSCLRGTVHKAYICGGGVFTEKSPRTPIGSPWIQTNGWTCDRGSGSHWSRAGSPWITWQSVYKEVDRMRRLDKREREFIALCS